MKKNDVIKNLKKKHSIFWIYKDTFIVLIVILLVILFLIPLYYISHMLKIDLYVLILDSMMAIGLILVIMFIPFCLCRAFIIMVKRARNARYLPLSHDECQKIDITDIGKYLEMVNSLLYSESNIFCYFSCPERLFKEIADFVRNEYGKEIKLYEKGFCLYDEENVSEEENNFT